MELNRTKYFIALSFALTLFIFLPHLSRGGVGGVKESGRGTVELRGKLHRFTGKVVSLDREKGSISIDGRGGLRRFTVTGKMAEEIKSGDKVRVYFSPGKGEKSIVKKWKKINNVGPVKRGRNMPDGIKEDGR